MSRGVDAWLPTGWSREHAKGLGPFITREVLRRADGTLVVWESRWHRKHAGVGSTWWAPRAIGWWIGVLFAIGSVGFAVGSFPPYATWVGVTADDATYFIGSLFFTTAAFLQYVEVGATRGNPSSPAGRRWWVFSWKPHQIDWWAAIVQFAGTLFFNRSTADAMLAGPEPSSINHLVWRPDALGSICFLVASGLAWCEVSDGIGSFRPHELSWWITGLNLLGSVAFGVSAVASYIEPSGTPRSLALTNLGTFVGAICFLAGAVLLLPERTATDRPGAVPHVAHDLAVAAP